MSRTEHDESAYLGTFTTRGCFFLARVPAASCEIATIKVKKEKDAQSVPESDQEAGREHRQPFCPSTITIWE